MASDEVVTLSCEGSSSNIQATKSVLCTFSRYFQNLFSFGNQGSSVKLDPAIISFPNLTLLVKYMQADELIPTIKNVEQLICAADYLQMDGALKILMEFLHTDMAKRLPGNIPKGVILIYLRLLEIIERYIKETGYKAIKIRMKPEGGDSWTIPVSACMYIGLCFKSVMYEQQVLQLSYDCLKKIFSANILGIPEEDVARTIKMWCNHDFATRKALFPELIRCVRYNPNMKGEFIMEELLCTCKIKDNTCQCLSAQDYVTVILGLRSGYNHDFSDKGPNISGQRAFHSRWRFE